jgi:lipoprotein-anchoring transpeptidase ErfK/SrfK
MRRMDNRLVKLAAVALMAVAEGAAQEAQSSGRRIVVSIPDRKLALLEDGRVVKIFRTAVGAPKSPSPTGTFTIVNRIPNPTWYTPGKVVAAGAENPLGTRWLGLSLKGFGIHGTNSPRSIGGAKSHGCIRMRNRDVEELFEMVRAGDVVELHDERTEELARIFNSEPAPAEYRQIAAARPPATENF